MQNLEAGVTITNLYVGTTEIAKSGGANWSVSGGKTVVLKKAYLATLDVGDTVFTAKASDGLTVSFTVTVSDSTTGNRVTPDSVIFDVNPEGANYKDVVMVVTPETDGATITGLFFVNEDDIGADPELPQTVEGIGTIWSVKDGLTATVYVEPFVTILTSDGSFEPGTGQLYFSMSDDSRAYFIGTMEDTRNA